MLLRNRERLGLLILSSICYATLALADSVKAVYSEQCARAQRTRRTVSRALATRFPLLHQAVGADQHALLPALAGFAGAPEPAAGGSSRRRLRPPLRRPGWFGRSAPGGQAEAGAGRRPLSGHPA